MCAADTSSNTTLPQNSCLTYHNRQLPTKQFGQKYFSVHLTIGSHYYDYRYKNRNNLGTKDRQTNNLVQYLLFTDPKKHQKGIVKPKDSQS